MTSYYKLILGGSEYALDPGKQWDDSELRALLGDPSPVSFPIAGGGQITVVPGPGIAVLREESSGAQVY